MLPIGVSQLHPLVVFVHPRLEPLFEGEPDLLECLVPAEVRCPGRLQNPQHGLIFHFHVAKMHTKLSCM